MEYNRPITVRCPYCQAEHRIKSTPLPVEQIITLWCGDDEEAGCGKLYAIRVSLNPKVIIYKVEEAHEQ